MKKMFDKGLRFFGVLIILISVSSIDWAEGSDNNIKSATTGNQLVIDLIKLAPYAKWTNSSGRTRFNRFQDKIECALHRNGALDRQEKRHGLTLFTTALGMEGYVRGKYSFYLPKAEKIFFEASTFIEKNCAKWMDDISVGYFAKGKGIKYLIKNQDSDKELKCDLSELGGQKADILIKVKGRNPYGHFIHWDRAKIIAFYPEKGKADLAISPSDIEFFSEGRGKTGINITIHNIAKKDSGKFKVIVYNGEDILGEKVFPLLSAKDSSQFNLSGLEFKEGLHKIKVKIESAEEENSKENNETVLICQLPVYGIVIKDIEALPYPWQTEYLKVNLVNNLTDTKDYLLKYTIYDYWDKEIISSKKAFSLKATSLEIRPFKHKWINWYKIKAEIFYIDKRIDSLSVNFCHVPNPRVSQPDSVFGISSTAKCIDTSKIYWQRFKTSDYVYQLTKDTGASRVRLGWNIMWLDGPPESDPTYEDYCKKCLIAQMDATLAQGQIPFVIVMIRPWGHEGDKKKSQNRLNNITEKDLNILKERTYEMVSRYKGKGIYWIVFGECNYFMPPKVYTRILKTFYEVAKKGAPDCKIIANPIVLGYQSPLDSGKLGTSYDWQREMYPQARGYFDGIGFHGYFNLLPEEPRYNAQVKPHIELIQKYGDLGKVELIDNEWQPAGIKSGTPASHTVRAYLYNLGKREKGISQMVYFGLQDYWIPNSYGRSGLCEFNSYPKPEYQAYAVAAYNLTGAEFVESKEIGENNYFYIFKRDKNKFVCAWKQKGQREVLVLPAKKKVKVVDLMGTEIYLKPENNKVKISISTDPIYITGLDLENFNVITRHDYTFEDEFPMAKKLKKSNQIFPNLIYEIARLKWERGNSSDVRQLIEKGVNGEPSEPLPIEETVISKYTRSSIAIDGNLSDWEDSNWHTVFSTTGKVRIANPANDKDLSYSFSSRWNKENFYIALKTKDNIIITKEGPKVYGGDCIEVFFDVANIRDPESSVINFSHYLFGLQSGVRRLGNIKNSPIRTTMKWKKTEEGYNAEIAIPIKEMFFISLKNVGKRLKGYRIAFDIAVDDADTENKVKCQLVWHGVRGHHHNSIGAGELVFK